MNKKQQANIKVLEDKFEELEMDKCLHNVTIEDLKESNNED